MSVYFADTSAFVKRYVKETGSGWVRSWIASSAGHTILIAEFSRVELASVLARRLREGVLTAVNVQQITNDFLIHTSTEYRLIRASKTVFQLASNLCLRHPLRTLDAIQLASALYARQITKSLPVFVSADQRLLAAAIAEGLPVDDPNAHP